ncbi:hypothetical protein C1H46_031303 [Malus baccata]|uniref:Uncharacterized protein n=1 Tax=Malus baccata TaxID=106549 RepID=A0A540L9M4_MALBA|nr:hypothetical protein C1H46_031303 [Malus baccata]
MKILRKRKWEELKTLWLLVYLHQGHLRKDDESIRSPEGRVNSPMTVRVSKFVKDVPAAAGRLAVVSRTVNFLCVLI